MLEGFRRNGRASFLLGGQWGSEGKGAAAAFTAVHLRERNELFDVVTTNAGAQAGHTSTHDDVTKVVFHLPTVSLYPSDKFQPHTYLNAGSIIDPEGLMRELDENPHVAKYLSIHPNAAIITPACREAEMRDDSAQTRIASTRKGVGEALSRKVLRSGVLAKDLLYPNEINGVPSGTIQYLGQFVRRLDLNDMMSRGLSVLVEVPQGHSLSVDGPFYPHTTSRNCTVMQAMSDAGIHPQHYHTSMLVVRTFPIRVGNIPGGLGYSGGHFPDHKEITWEDLGVKAEITTVTKRVRRVFTFSEQQVQEAIAATRPSVVYLTFCDYVPQRSIVRLMVDRLRTMCHRWGSVKNGGVEILTQWGPTTADVIRGEEV